MMDLKIPKVFVIVLNFNGNATLNECLSSIFQSDYANFETVIVDNDSRDDSFEKARASFSKAHFIKNSANIGFSKGNNIGIRYALEKFADYVLVLNNDAIITKTTLTELAKAAKNNTRAGILSPVIKNPTNNTTWFAGGIINWRKMRTKHLTNSPSDKPYLTEYITGCAMFVSKNVFKKIGLFDERYFLYYEDADFSMRANKAGFELCIVPSINVQHLEQSTTENKMKTYWLVLSGLIFFHDHASFFQKIWLTPYLMLRKLKNHYNCLFSPNPTALNVGKAYRDYRKNF
jgi:GT2 family glycosyltransferase